MNKKEIYQNDSLSRREFLGLSATAAAMTLSPFANQNAKIWGQEVQNAANAPAKKRWFKGNLHSHSHWSDGEPLPEIALEWYRSRGYHFICPSDHDIFQSDALRFNGFGHPSPIEDFSAFKGETSYWKSIAPRKSWAQLTQEEVDQAKERFGADSIRTKTVNGLTFVRLKTFDELAAQFCKPNEFLMIPGYEQTGHRANGFYIHMNFINVRKTIPNNKSQYKTPRERIRDTYKRGCETYQDENYLFTANHPMWPYYDYSPNDLIALPQIRLFELNNNNVDHGLDPHPQAWTPEKFWDIVNAWRAAHDQPLLLGMGSDDRHHYGPDFREGGWTVVRSQELTIDSLFTGIRAGDFYASNGLDFEDIRFDGKTLEVKINVQEEGNYRIYFIGTKKDYDRSFKTIDLPAGDKNQARCIDVFSNDIGVVLDTVDGIEGSYTLKPDDLYVRAKIVKMGTDSKEDWRCGPAAWTQPWR